MRLSTDKRGLEGSYYMNTKEELYVRNRQELHRRMNADLQPIW